MRYTVRFLLPALLFIMLAVGSGCGNEAPEQPLVDAEYLTADRWNDGRAEVAFYRVHRAYNPYGEPAEQTFLVGTYLVKHSFDAAKMTKAESPNEGMPAFKYGLFYEFESGSYQYKRSYVTNARQRDLRPLKSSLASFDWCSNLYEEFAFHMTGAIDYLKRSDDYGNASRRFQYQPRVVPTALVPLLVRGLDVMPQRARQFAVVRPDGQFVPVQAAHAGRDTVQVAGRAVPATRIRLTYSQRTPSPIAETVDSTETYWRGTGPARLLLRMESGSGSYRMELVEHLRTAYWEENIWPMLERVEQRP